MLHTIPSSDFFWGVVVGVVLTLFGAYIKARLTVRWTRKEQQKMVVKFCIDEVKNLQGIIKQLEETRTFMERVWAQEGGDRDQARAAFGDDEPNQIQAEGRPPEAKRPEIAGGGRSAERGSQRGRTRRH
jgi:hypothetical protein